MSKEVSLVKASMEDARQIYHLFDTNTIKWLNGINLPLSIEECNKWISNLLKHDANLFIIKQDMTSVGLIWIEHINLKDRTGEIGFLIGNQFQGKGYGYKAGNLLINLAYGDLELEELSALTTNHNKASQKLLEKLGFKLSKKIKKDYFDKKLDKWCDVLEYRLVKNYEFWNSWKNKTAIEKNAIKAVKKAIKLVAKSVPSDKLVGIYIKGSFTRREMKKGSDVDMVPIVTETKVEKAVFDVNNQKVSPVMVVPLSLEEFKHNKLFTTTDKNPDLRAKPDRLLKKLYECKLVYGKPVNPNLYPIRDDKTALKDEISVLKKGYIPYYEKGELSFDPLLKEVFWLVELEQNVAGIKVDHSFSAIAKSVKNKDHIIHDALDMRLHPNKNKESDFIENLKKHLNELDDFTFFDSKLTNLKEKSKYLLKDNYQKQVLNDVIKIAQGLKEHSDIQNIWIGGSIVKKQLGKYAKKWNEREYSDIDLFILVNKPLNKINLSKIGLVKKLHKSRSKRYYRISVADINKQPLKLLDRFSVDVWLFTPISYKNDLQRFPDLLKKAIKI